MKVGIFSFSVKIVDFVNGLDFLYFSLYFVFFATFIAWGVIFPAVYAYGCLFALFVIMWIMSTGWANGILVTLSCRVTKSLAREATHGCWYVRSDSY